MRRIWFAPAIAMALCASSASSKLFEAPYEKGEKAYAAQDYEEAYKQWRKGAKNGDVMAMTGLGLLWYYGLSTSTSPANHQHAADWFLAAARKGWSPAMISLAEIYLAKGHSVEAKAWLENAARWGSAPAADRLRQLGWHVPPPDLWDASQQQERAQRDQNRAIIGTAFLCGVTGYCGGTSSGYYTAPKKSPPYTCRPGPVFTDVHGKPMNAPSYTCE